MPKRAQMKTEPWVTIHRARSVPSGACFCTAASHPAVPKMVIA